MNILYVGPLFEGGICGQRKRILEELGCKVYPVDNTTEWPILSPKGLIYRASYMLQHPLDLISINSKLIEMCKNTEIDVLWIDKGMTIYPRTLEEIRNLNQDIFLLNFNPDDPFCPLPWGWGWFKKSIPLYNLCIVPREKSIKEYYNAGAREVYRFIWGYSEHVHKPIEVSQKDVMNFGGKVGFIGSFEVPRSLSLINLSRHEILVRVWGDGWKAVQKEYDSKYLKIAGRSIWSEDFAKAICSFDINLCFLNKLNKDTINTRCFAIPACGGFMLAERTDDLLAHFEEGKEADFFSFDEEMIEKTKYYLKHEDIRKKIATAGRRRCIKGGYSNHNRLTNLLKGIKQLKGGNHN